MSLALVRKAALTAFAASLLATQAQARVGQICLELPVGADVVKAKIASGCLPTSPGHKGAFEVDVDSETATIVINGAYKPVRKQRIGTADCMGRQIITQEAKAAGPRRYSVLVNGSYRGVIDASYTMVGLRAVQRCFPGAGQIQMAAPDRVTTYSRQQFKDWIGPGRGEPHGKGKPTKPSPTPILSATLGELAAKLLGPHPDTIEGTPSAEITISRARWRDGLSIRVPRGGGARNFMAIQIEEHGYADDSVSGRRTFAMAQRDARSGEWRANEVWRQFMCSRGEKAGQWSGEPCA